MAMLEQLADPFLQPLGLASPSLGFGILPRSAPRQFRHLGAERGTDLGQSVQDSLEDLLDDMEAANLMGNTRPQLLEYFRVKR
jgi:hypothetical protein